MRIVTCGDSEETLLFPVPLHMCCKFHYSTRVLCLAPTLVSGVHLDSAEHCSAFPPSLSRFNYVKNWFTEQAQSCLIAPFDIRPNNHVLQGFRRKEITILVVRRLTETKN